MPHKRLLVIDDESDIREVARLSLELTEDWAVLSANGGASGMTLALSMAPDAILLDVMMPDMDGPTTLRALQEQSATKSIPVIFLTAKVQATEREKFMQLGVRAIIAKPFDPLSLGQQIRDALGWLPAAN
jgi:CheY-like chemotaxis protein